MCACSEFLDGGVLLSYQLFHVKHSDRRSLDSCQSVRSDCVAQSVRHVPCIPVPMRKRSNRADAKMKADLHAGSLNPEKLKNSWPSYARSGRVIRCPRREWP